AAMVTATTESLSRVNAPPLAAPVRGRRSKSNSPEGPISPCARRPRGANNGGRGESRPVRKRDNSCASRHHDGSLFRDDVVALLLDVGKGILGGHLAGENRLEVGGDHLVVDLLAAGAELPRLSVRASLE